MRRHGWVDRQVWCSLIVLCILFKSSPCYAFGIRDLRGRWDHMDGGGNNPEVALLAGGDVEDRWVFHGQWIRGGNSRRNRSGGDMIGVFTEFWNQAFRTASTNIQSVFRRGKKQEDSILEELSNLPIRGVTVPNTTVLPPEVVRVAVKRSGIIGNPLRADRIQEVAKSLKLWYMRNGYVLHSVTGANLKADTATAEILVEEPSASSQPVEIVAVKEMIVTEDGDLLTFRQYVDRQANKRAFRHDRIEKSNLNTTYVESIVRTNPRKLAKALKLVPGKPFQWNGGRWKTISSCGIFSKVIRVSPRRLNDGSVQLQVIATEPPPRHLEYGLGKSLYTGTWEGEVDFEHQNLFGGGEVLGLMVRRGTKDTEPSIRLRYGDDRFGLEGGYDVDIFSDYLGDYSADSDTSGSDSQTGDTFHSKNGDLCFRKGGTIRIQNPISTSILRNSVISTSFERTSSRSGKHEKIGSTTVTLGPVLFRLPFEARSSIVTSLTGGARLGENSADLVGSVLPYSSGSATARHILPLSYATRNRGRPPVLALQHTLSSSTRHLPGHEAKAMSVSSQIRGCSPNGAASSSIKGTAELRFPIRFRQVDNASVVVFGDWFRVKPSQDGQYEGKQSVGFGIRKVISGLPLKYEVCYTSEGKIKTMFGLGPDFDA